ncbi:MAG: hypothetical protein WCT77_02660 [Bacteroidota bacterium]|jgi:hypothetical protein
MAKTISKKTTPKKEVKQTSAKVQSKLLTEKSPVLLTAAKIAIEVGVTPAKIKQVIAELKIEPDMIRCNCNYYTDKTILKIKKGLG